MTAPRQVLPGTTYLVTRRCAQRQLLLRPSASTNAIFSYVLAVAARRFNVLLHVWCVLSNHFHLVVTDPDANLPAFEQYLDSLVARAVNASLGRWEAFWAPSSYSAVALATPEDVIDKCAYVLANPVAANLVRRGREWPGLWSAPEQIGTPLQVVRPSSFFRKNGPLPDCAELVACVPPGFDAAVFRDELSRALSAREDEAAALAEREHRTFLGPKRVLSQSPTTRPQSEEPHRALSPRIAARDRWKRIEVLARVVGFLRWYRASWCAMRSGAKNVLFPPGTYLLRVSHGVACAPCG